MNMDSGFHVHKWVSIDVNMMLLRYLGILCLCLLIHCDPVLDEDYDAAVLWGEDSVDFSWNLPVVSNHTILLNTTMKRNVTVDIEDDVLLDMSFHEEELEFVKRLDLFLENLFGNATDTDHGPYTFVTTVTLLPLRCSNVKKIVDMFNAAIHKANPSAAAFNSVARRLGKSACSGDGICPCIDLRRYMTRVLEIQTVSPLKHVLPPSIENFPYPFEMKAVS